MNSPPSHPDISSLQQQQIHADKILLIHQNMPVIILGNLLGAIPLTIILWSEDLAIQLMIWISVLYLVTFIRWLHCRSLNAKIKDRESIFIQGKEYILLVFLSGSIWGGAGFLFFNPDAVAPFTFLMLTLVAMVSSSMTALSSRFITYVCYAIPIMMPIIIKLFMQGLAFYSWMGLGTLAYLILSLAFSRNIHRSTDQSLYLKYKNLELVENLKQQTQAANKANKDKSRFLAAASHDLRQPLHAVNLFVETLSQKITDKQQLHDLNRICRGLDSLHELFDALLDITRLDTEVIQINLVDFELNELIQKLADQFSAEIASKQLHLQTNNCNKIIRSDPILLERMLRNLLSNAIRYTEKGSIEIVCDDNVNKQLQLHSELGKGTDFIIQIPLGNSTAKTSNIAPITVAKNKLQNIEVLVIDNETEILDAMQGLLGGWGCRFIGADSTKAALKHIHNGKQPDFILADYRLPGNINGCELVSNIRDELGDIPALIISGDIDTEVINEIKASGLTLLSKPLKPAQLRLAMARLIS